MSIVRSRNLLTFLAAGLLCSCSGTNPDDAGYGSAGQAGNSSRPAPSRNPTGTDDTSSEGAGSTHEGTGNGHEGCNNGFDEDGDGLIDEGCTCAPGDKQYCYVGDLAHGGVGVCSWGTQTCELPGGTEFETGAWGPCEGYGTPSDDVCDGADNDCDGMVDEDCSCVPGSTQKCGINNGACHFGEQVCNPDGTWGECLGGSGPTSEVCNGMDDDCDGQIDEGLSCQCMPGMQEPCGLSTGECAPGSRVCQADGSWSACVGALLPKPEVCNGLDDDCDGIVDPGCQCASGTKMPCNLYPNVGVCHDGQIVCQPGGTWSSCMTAQGPTAEVCDDGLDNDCDGEVDEGCTITLTLKIIGLNNDAMFEDCLFVRIGGGAAHPIGCNHDAGMVGKQVSFQLPGPACYQVGFEMTIDNTHTVRTVAVGGAEDHRWKVLDQTPVRVEFEDNTDNDYNDFQFTVEMDRTYFGIKGRPIGCK